MNEPRDIGAYRIAVGAIGCALVVVLIGLCVIVAVGVESEKIPEQLWTITSALGGGLLGLLAPSPTPSVAKSTEPVEGPGKKAGRLLEIFLKDVWANRSVVILLVIFGVAVWLGETRDSEQLKALAAASGAALIGLLAPAPGKSTGEK